LTLNLGARYDGENGSVPAQHLPAGPFVPARDFAAQKHIPNFKDLNPRLGAAYDLFGNGRTAIKASLSRNLAFDPPGGIVQLNNPVNLMVISTTRTWSVPGLLRGRRGQSELRADLRFDQSRRELGGRDRPAARSTTTRSAPS
jgi:hypothetical protein